MLKRILEKFKKKEVLVESDNKYLIEDILKQWIDEIGMTDPILYRYRYNERILTIYTNRPGWMIGLYGETINKYRALLERHFVLEIKFVETNNTVIYPNKGDSK